MADPIIGILTAPSRLLSPRTTLSKRHCQVNLDCFNAALCAGSCAVYRRAAVEPFGGAAPIEHSEDMFTGFEMTQLGRSKVRQTMEQEGNAVVAQSSRLVFDGGCLRASPRGGRLGGAER